MATVGRYILNILQSKGHGEIAARCAQDLNNVRPKMGTYIREIAFRRGFSESGYYADLLNKIEPGLGSKVRTMAQSRGMGETAIRLSKNISENIKFNE